MNIKVSTENGQVAVTVAQVAGNLDSSTYENFQAQLEELIENGSRHILVDLSRTSFISSAGLLALHNILIQLRKLHSNEAANEESVPAKSPYLKLLSPSREAMMTLDLGGFNSHIETYTDLKKAVDSFKL